MAAAGTPAIAPPEGWRVQSPLGVLKTNTGRLLVRLEDVHAWIMQRHVLPSASAVARVFGAFASDANSAVGMEHGAAKVREFLHLTDLSGYAEPVSEFAGRHFLREVAELLPHVPHHHFDRGTPEALMYSLGLMAGEVWAPHAVDIDLNERLDGYCPNGEFPAVAKAREILGRLAVPFAAAHALWGWGSVVTVDTDASSIAAASAELGANDVNDAETLVRYRQQFKGVAHQKRPQWTCEHRSYLDEAVRTYGGAAELAKLLGVTAEAVRGQLRKAEAEATKKKKADAFTSGLGHRNKAA